MTRILRASDRNAAPWKNGGGTTEEVAVFPPGAGFEEFGWRVSIADMTSSGPFSMFPGIDRQLVLLKGRVALTIAGQGTMELTPATAPVAFPGDAAADAHVSEGPATDLNVMTRRGTFRSSVERKASAGKLIAAADVTLLFSLSAATMTEDALAPTDALLMKRGECVELISTADFYWIEIFSSGT